MKCFALFTDASLNPGLKLGVGAYLLIPSSFLENPLHLIKRSEVDKRLTVRRFEGMSSTKLEVQTVLWALEEFRNESKGSGLAKLHVYSDSQCVEGLLRRRRGLEDNSFCGKKSDRPLKNASLYRKYYQLHDKLGFKVTKVAGHTRPRSHDAIQRIFSFVDQGVRKTLKIWMRKLKAETAEWSLYMVRCRDGSLYTGISSEVPRRFAEHQEMGKKGAKYLRGKGPLELVFCKKVGNKALALKTEYKLKRLSKSKKESIIKTPHGNLPGLQGLDLYTSLGL